MKLKTWVKRWASDSEPLSGLVDFYHSERARAVDGSAQMHYSTFVKIFGIALEPERVYSLRTKATAKPRTS
jgi:hypothetical protein